MSAEREGYALTRKRGIYLLPNLFTTAGLFAGFYAIVTAMKGHFEEAAIAIFAAMIADALDGRIARLTNSQSLFGAQYDSLSDLVAFGVAPALVCFSWSLFYLGKLGWLAAFIFTAAGALRLARFNAQIGTADKRFFQGLPIPSGAGVLASTVWICHEYQISGRLVAIFIAIMTIITALLMVSNIRYHSFKEFTLRDRVPFVTMMLLVLVFVWLTLAPSHILFIVFILYALSGPVLTLYVLRQKRKARRRLLKSNR